MIMSRHSSVCSVTSLNSLTISQFKLKHSLIYIKDRKYLYVSVCTGNLLVICFGMAYAWSSPVLLRLTHEEFLDTNPLGRILTQDEAAWIGSLLPLGGMFGTFLAGNVAARLGRKASLIINCAVPFVAAFSIIAVAKTVFLYYIARVLVGFAVSGVYTVVPMYLVEISEDSIRGFICCSIMTFETFGELITFLLCPYMSIFGYSIIFVMVTVFVVLMVLTFLPESPYYLMSVKKRSAAEKSLMKVRACTAERVRSELDFIESVMEEAEKEQSSVFGLLKTKAARRAEAISFTLTILQHCSGIVPIVFYSQSIFQETGSTLKPDYCTIIIGIIQCLSSFVAPNIVDKLGRRWTLFISAFGMFISELFLGLYFFMKDNKYDLEPFYWLPIVCLVMYLVSYISGIGPLLWTIMGELFPPHLKSPAFTFGVFIWWASGFVMSRAFSSITGGLGMAGTFWLFSGDCFLAMIFSLTCVIETKGQTFQEIQDILNQ